MAGDIRLGYPLAAVGLPRPRDGRLWLAGHLHPGDTVSRACLLELLRAAAARLGGQPRRRTELRAARIQDQQPRLAALIDPAPRLTVVLQRLARQREQAHSAQQQGQRRLTRRHSDPVSPQQDAPFGARSLAQQQPAEELFLRLILD